MLVAEICVILDQLVAPVPGGIGRYSLELTRALIDSAPHGSTVTGFASADRSTESEGIEARLPGLSQLRRSPLERRALALAWEHGFTGVSGARMVHSPSQLAPLFRHDRSAMDGQQVAVTIHDTVAWTNPEALTPRGVSWHRKMAHRAEKYADVVVVTSHTVADQLGEYLDLGERVRVIPAAMSSGLALPSDAADRAVALSLPDRYVLSVGTLEPRKRMDALIAAMASSALDGIDLVHVGPMGWGDVDLQELATAAGLPPERIHALGSITDSDLAVVYDRAAVLAFPSDAEGFGLPLLEAFAMGTPAVHSDAPALVELSAGAGISVLRAGDHYASRFAEALRGVLDDPAEAARMTTQGRDRARGFSWRDSAEKVWQLHADL